MINAIWNDATLDERMRADNHNLWVQRYQTAPAITPSGLKGGGDGFIVPGSNDHNEAHLQRRASERDACLIHADKTRLGLLYNAEFCAVSPDASAMDKRQSMGRLLDYDHQHGHPVADSSRNFHREPMSPLEQSRWMQRPGRQKTPEEHDWSRANEEQIEHDQRIVRDRPDNAFWHIHHEVAQKRSRLIADHAEGSQPVQGMDDHPNLREKLAQRRGMTP